MVTVSETTIPIDLPAGAPGSWCLVSATARGGRWWAQLQMTDRARGHFVRQVFLGPCRGGVRRTLMHMPAEAGALTLLFLGEAATFGSIRIRVLSRAGAALRLLLFGWRRLGVAARGDRLGRMGRIRATLGQAPARHGEAPPYAVWLALYEPPAAQPVEPPAIQVVVVRGDASAMAATLASTPADTIVVETQEDWDRLERWPILVLGAGEILAPHALALFGASLAQAPQAEFLCADADAIDRTGRRLHPLFKPQPGPAFLQSGLLTAGACVFRLPPERRRAAVVGLPPDADGARLALANRCDPSAMLRVPAILTHLPTSPVARQTMSHTPSDAGAPSVSVIIPSACRSASVLRCLRALTGDAHRPGVEFLLAVSRIDANDRRQSACLAEAAALPGVRVLDLALPAFNFSQVNNAAARQARGEYLLFLNDDVAPVTKHFVPAMLSRMSQGVGAVGARLLYGNDTIQHAGVIMGLGGLCEHACRLAASSDAGDHGRNRVDREVSAVTAACLLMPARLFAEVGGFDEAFAVALNDVDLCLQIRATGARIVYAADVTLIHHESLSLGRHYEGGRAWLEAREVRRLRARWSRVIAEDPYYNPQASLEPGREWQPAFPPRTAQQCNDTKGIG
jgi:GT2 family glycosyltransferase